MTLILSLLLLFAPLMRVYIAYNRGVFYAKNNKNVINQTVIWLRANIHRLATYGWWLIYLTTVLGLVAFYGVLHWITVVEALWVAFMAMSLSSFPYQGVINICSGLPFLDEKEYHKSEWNFFGFSIWRPRFIKGWCVLVLMPYRY